MYNEQPKFLKEQARHNQWESWLKVRDGILKFNQIFEMGINWDIVLDKFEKEIKDEAKSTPLDEVTNGWTIDVLLQLQHVYYQHPFTKSMFLFRLYTGCRSQDLFGIKLKKILEILENLDENKCLTLKPKKTSVVRHYYFC